MPEIKCREMEGYLKSLQAARPEGPAPVYLFSGEEFLYKNALDKLLTALLPEGKTDVLCEPFDGADVDIYALAERLATFSLFAGRRVIVLKDAQIFGGKENDIRLLEKAREAAGKDNQKAAARHLASALGILGLSWDDVTRERRGQSLKFAAGLLEEDAWLDGLLEYCREHQQSIPRAADSERVLQEAIEKGFPAGNILVVTTDQVDRRKALYKLIKERGVVVDCSVPKGSRKADRDAQTALLMEHMKTALARHGMTADAGVFQAVCELTGFDLRAFAGNLELLINFGCKQGRITLPDVEAALRRTRKDAVYELTGALAEKNLPQVLFYLDSLLGDGYHPLQILAAMVNQIRRLCCARGFLQSQEGRAFDPGMRFDRFKVQVVPAIQTYEARVADQVAAWEEAPGDLQRRKKGGALPPELVILKQPQNAYPAFLLLKSAAGFTPVELAGALKLLYQSDRRLKMSQVDPRLILEEAVLRICKNRPLI